MAPNLPCNPIAVIFQQTFEPLLCYPLHSPNDRDTNRIVAAAQALGIKQFDYIVATHHDADHSGNVPNLAAKIPAKIYIDHGEVVATASDKNKNQFYEPYLKFVDGRKRTIVKPGYTIPLKGVWITVVSAGGDAITKPMPGAGQPNPLAVDVKPEPVDVCDNAGSIGPLYQLGKFRR